MLSQIALPNAPSNNTPSAALPGPAAGPDLVILDQITAGKLTELDADGVAGDLILFDHVELGGLDVNANSVADGKRSGAIRADAVVTDDVVNRKITRKQNACRLVPGDEVAGDDVAGGGVDIGTTRDQDPCSAVSAIEGSRGIDADVVVGKGVPLAADNHGCLVEAVESQAVDDVVVGYDRQGVVCLEVSVQHDFRAEGVRVAGVELLRLRR